MGLAGHPETEHHRAGPALTWSNKSLSIVTGLKRRGLLFRSLGAVLAILEDYHFWDSASLGEASIRFAAAASKISDREALENAICSNLLRLS